jgi:hypothetical protein
MREVRLGDIIDDFCVKCKRIMNHSVVSMLGAEPAKVRCRTCYSDHDYRHEIAPPPKIDSRKAALFNQVLAKLQPDAAVPVDGAPVLEIDPDTDADLELEADTEPEAVVEMEAEPPPPVAAKSKSNVRTKKKK